MFVILLILSRPSEVHPCFTSFFCHCPSSPTPVFPIDYLDCGALRPDWPTSFIMNQKYFLHSQVVGFVQSARGIQLGSPRGTPPWRWLALAGRISSVAVLSAVFPQLLQLFHRPPVLLKRYPLPVLVPQWLMHLVCAVNRAFFFPWDHTRRHRENEAYREPIKTLMVS